MATGHELAMALRLAYRAMHRRSDAQFRRLGVTADQFVLLSALVRGDGITQQELVRRTSSDPNTVRAMLLLLERRGLVSREPHLVDGRARSVTLTRKGRKVHGELLAKSEPVRLRMLAGLRRREVPFLVDLLGRIAREMAEPEARGVRRKIGDVHRRRIARTDGRDEKERRKR